MPAGSELNEGLGRFGVIGCFPGQAKVLLGGRALSEVEIDQGLIGDRHFLRKSLEVSERRFI